MARLDGLQPGPIVPTFASLSRPRQGLIYGADSEYIPHYHAMPCECRPGECGWFYLGLFEGAGSGVEAVNGVLPLEGVAYVETATECRDLLSERFGFAEDLGDIESADVVGWLR